MKRAERSPLAAYEAAEDAIAAGDTAPELRIAAVLALARCGATDFALERFDAFRLAERTTDENALALHGRLLKDKAMALDGAARKHALIDSAGAYMRAYMLTGGSYSGINAATLFCLAGQRAEGLEITGILLSSMIHLPQKLSPEDKYFHAATLAEAYLLQDWKDQAGAALTEAIAHDPHNYTAHASTLRQFQRILDASETAYPEWLNALRPPASCFFAGRMPDKDGELEDAGTLKTQIGNEIAKHRIGFAFGALAAGSDILFAESLLEAGGDLHVVLPCDPAPFMERSVTPFKADWTARFQHCLSQATKITQATPDASLQDKLAIDLAARLAMGKAMERADELATDAFQMLIGSTPSSMSAHFGALWAGSDRGFPGITIGPDMTGKPREAVEPVPDETDRQLCAMLFADLTDFSSLTDAEVLSTVTGILTPLASTLQGGAVAPLHLDSWGDGIFAVFEDAADAAEMALAMQDCMRGLDLDGAGLPDGLSLRIGIHYGPVTFMTDPVTGARGIYGSQIAYAAKIEPLAFAGSTLASEAFCAALALAPASGITSTYVGRYDLKNIADGIRLFALSPKYTA